MHLILFNFCLLALSAEISETAPAIEQNTVFSDLVEKGVRLSDGKEYKLPPPVLAEGLDAAGQKAAIEKIAPGRYSFDDLIFKSTSAPVLIKFRTLKKADDEAATIRAIDVWFVAYGKWDTLNSKEFLDSLAKGRDTERDSKMVSKSGFLTDEEMQKRNLKIELPEGQEAKFVYNTFSLFDQIEVSATRYAVVTRGQDFLLAAGRVDKRFDDDKEFPNQWRPIERDAAANITLGPPHIYTGAGAYAKITRLVEPADAIFVEGHIVFEEPYGWFEGGNMLRSKAPVMIQQRAKIFRSRLGIASAKEK